jgi:hypothetical protein
MKQAALKYCTGNNMIQADRDRVRFCFVMKLSGLTSLTFITEPVYILCPPSRPYREWKVQALWRPSARALGK